jgi:hypothetical protein
MNRGSAMSVLTASPRASEEGFRPSNRSTNTSETRGGTVGVEPIVHIDTIKVQGHIRDHYVLTENLQRVTHPSTGEISERPRSSGLVELRPGANLKVHYRNNQALAVMEFSVPTVLTGTNTTPATVGETQSLVEDLHTQASEWVDWEDNYLDLTINRLDLDRDFQVGSDLVAVLDGLVAVPVPRVTVTHRYVDSKRGGAETLTKGVPGRWNATLYDKQAQVRHLAGRQQDDYAHARLLREAEAAEGVLRFEVGLRRDPLRAEGITTVAGLADIPNLARVRSKYFERARFNQEVGGMNKIETVVKQITLSPEQRKMTDRMLGILMFDALGQPQVASDETVRRHRALAREYGLSPADLSQPDRPTIALDYQSGTLRRAA